MTRNKLNHELTTTRERGSKTKPKNHRLYSVTNTSEHQHETKMHHQIKEPEQALKFANKTKHDR